MKIEFEGKIFEWRGPAPFYFVAVPEEESTEIKSISSMITYGWGMVPVRVTIGETTIKTALFPKEEFYLVPIKSALRKAEDLEVGDTIKVELFFEL